eukprot:5843171-Amphidinium_carterae.1
MSFWEFSCPAGWTAECDHMHDHCGATSTTGTADDSTNGDSEVGGADRSARYGVILLTAFLTVRA